MQVPTTLPAVCLLDTMRIYRSFMLHRAWICCTTSVLASMIQRSSLRLNSYSSYHDLPVSMRIGSLLLDSNVHIVARCISMPLLWLIPSKWCREAVFNVWTNTKWRCEIFQSRWLVQLVFWSAQSILRLRFVAGRSHSTNRLHLLAWMFLQYVAGTTSNN